jgi:alkanesulfonate monooxygenase SsuD/methylene tetrahydromethanopterin reductase-like flavin-dependent oxidoreductase (luciferase family)
MRTPLRNPAILAKMAVTLDEVSSRRFTLGPGAGWNSRSSTRSACHSITALAALEAACTEGGRDPATLAVTVGVTVAYPDLETPPHALDTYLHGSAEETAEALVGYDELGVAYMMVRTIPSTMIGLTRLTQAFQEYGRISAGASA